MSTSPLRVRAIFGCLAVLVAVLVGAPGSAQAAASQFVNDTNASAGAANPTTITNGQPRLSWTNDSASTVTRQRVQVVSTPLTNVVGLWHLDRATVLGDATGLGHTLTAGGSPVHTTSVNGAFGGARTFASSRWYSTPSAGDLSMTTNFTVEAWFRASGPLPAFKTIVSKQQQASPWGANYRLGMDGTGTKLEFFFSKGGMTSTVTPGVTAATWLDGTWHHIAGTYDGSNAVLYIDGVARATVASTGNADTYATPLVIGNSVNFSADEWVGDIDEVRVSNVARSANDIAGYYRTRLPHFTELWDSDPTDGGTVALASSCAAAARCSDVTYDSSGPPALSLQQGARYFARAKFKPTAAAWTAWGSWDWFQMSGSSLLAPTNLFTANGVAQAGTANASSISSHVPSFSLLNALGATATGQRLRVQTDVVDANVLGLWHFDSATGTTTDSSTYANPTSSAGTVTYPAGATGFSEAMSVARAGELTATGIPVDRTPGATTTLDFWMKWDGTYDVVPVGWGTTGSKISLWIDPAGHFGFCTESNSEVYGVDKPVTDSMANRWVHIAAVFVNGAPASNLLYIDGVQQSLSLFNSTQIASNAYVNSTLQMGGGGWDNTWRFGGQLDDVRVTDGTRTAAEISGYAKTGAPHGTVLWDSNPGDTGAALASCTTATRCADITYAGPPPAQPGARYYVTAKYRTAAGTWSPWSSADWFSTSANAPPGTPSSPSQFRADGITSIAPGASTPDGATTNIVLSFNVSDADAGQSIRPWVEVRPNATPFSAACGATVAGATFTASPTTVATGGSGTTFTVNVTGLATAASYHWRACAVDQNGAASAWLSAGGNPDFRIDPSLTISLDNTTAALSSIIPLTDGTGTSVATITTDAPNGYTLVASDQDDAWALRTASSQQLLDHTGACTAPSVWTAGTAGGFGITVLAASGGATSRLAKWGTGTGTPATDFTNNRYCGLDQNTTSTLHVRNGFFATADTVTLGYRVNVPAAQPAGAYSGTISLTATANP